MTRSARFGTWPLCLVLAGCAHVRERVPSDEPFTCRGRRAPPSSEPIVTNIPTGRLVIELVPGTAPTRPSAEGKTGFALVPKIRVLAEATPLSAFARRLGEVTGVAVSVDPAVANVPVSLGAPALSFFQLLGVLGSLFDIGAWDSYPGHSTGRTQTPSVRFLPVSKFLEQRRWASWIEAEKTLQVIPLNHVRGAEMARALCEQALSSGGTVSVVGSILVARDYPPMMGQVRNMVSEIDSDHGVNATLEPVAEEGLCEGR